MEAKGYILKTTQTATDFEILLKQISRENSYFIAQRVDSIIFDNFDSSVGLRELLEKGRIFRAEFEVRYELHDGNYDLMVFFEDESKVQNLNLPGIPAEYELSESPDKIYLWGSAKKIGNGLGFIEVQIPKILEYPEVSGTAEGHELIIRARDYKKNHLPCFTRFIGVESHDPKGD